MKGPKYTSIKYIRIEEGKDRGKYKFFDESQRDKNIVIDNFKELSVVLNYYKQFGWKFIRWDNDRLLMTQGH